MLNKSLKSFLIYLVILVTVSSCQTWAPQNYEVVFKYHPKVGGGTKFGVMDHKFLELTTEEIDELLKTAIIIPSYTWAKIAEDIVKACNLLGKKCDYEVVIIDDILRGLKKNNEKLDLRRP